MVLILNQRVKTLNGLSKVLKGIVSSAVGGHSVLVTSLQAMHTDFGRSHDYEMKKQIYSS